MKYTYIKHKKKLLRSRTSNWAVLIFHHRWLQNTFALTFLLLHLRENQHNQVRKFALQHARKSKHFRWVKSPQNVSPCMRWKCGLFCQLIISLKTLENLWSVECWQWQLSLEYGISIISIQKIKMKKCSRLQFY